MNRQTITALLVAAVVLAGLGAAAASIDVLEQQGGGAGLGDESGSSSSSDGGVSTVSSGGESQSPSATILPLLTRILDILFPLAVLASAIFIWHKFGPRALVPLVFVALIAFLISNSTGEMAMFGERPQMNETTPDAVEQAGGTLAEGTNISQSLSPPLIVALLVGAVVVGVALFFVFAGDDTPEDETAETDDSFETDVEGVAEAAGAAADRLATGATDADNEIIRSWREMTTHLDVAAPATSTPAEFASAAVDAGMDADDVAELTRLFEETRYGEYPVTDERATRATETLRRIESQYGGER